MQSVTGYQTPAESRQNPLTSKRPDISLIRQQVACTSVQMFAKLQPLEQQGRPTASIMHSVRSMGGYPMNKLLFVHSLNHHQRRLKRVSPHARKTS